MRTIGASFSGGGFRAAAFTFGCLDMLHKARSGDRSLLDNIAFSSSTSGGSIAMAYHALRSYQGAAFPTILQEVHGLMKGDALLAEAMRILEEKKEWLAHPAKNRNLINAFAIAYDRLFYKGAQFGFLADKAHNPPIERYCFNATDLNHGLSFRFDHDGNPATISDVGNGRQRFAPGTAPVAHALRLADIAASSSCFPVGFEPMVFPDDFESTPAIGLGASLINELDAPLDREDLPFGLVDGGAVDNQGLRSLQIETSRRVSRQLLPFDLLLICDVSSFYMDRYVVPERKGAWMGGSRLGHILLMVALGALGILLAWVISLCLHAWAIAGALLLPVVMIGAMVVFLARRLGKGDEGSWKIMFKRFGLPLLRRMSLRTLRYFIVPRLRTLGLLLNSVFMNEIRRQQYRSLYEGMVPPLPIISCMVYELATKNKRTLDRRMAARRRKTNVAYVHLWDVAVAPLKPSPAMIKVADSAACMPTTLWFDTANDTKLDDLITCGRFTMCFNLLMHLADRIGAKGTLSADEQALQNQLLAVWAEHRDH